ncbi:MAG: class I SAM-dependent methyltransferase [Desulfosoma sp.]
MRHTLDIVLRFGEPHPIEEVLFSRRFCLRYLEAFSSTSRILCRSPLSLDTVGSLRSFARADTVFVVNEDEVLVTPHIFAIIPERLSRGPWAALMPALSPARHAAQQAPLAYPYHTVRTFLETADILRASRSPEPRRVPAEAEWPCLFLRREALDDLPDETPLDALWPHWAHEGRIGMVDACFVHRFAFVHESPREDLVRLIPETARCILDVGCAYGALGRWLKSLRPCHVTGIERNPHMARAAASFYDAVITLPVEEARFDRRFDAVVCGDVIEHLRDPSGVLRRLCDALTADGVLIASVPNTGHWSVVMDLALGRFEMVPAGFLCSTHLRFFTEKDLTLLLDQAGWAVDSMERDQSPPTPAGSRFIQTIVAAGFGDEQSLLTERFRFRARKKGRSA